MNNQRIITYHLCGHRFLNVNPAGDKVIADGDDPAAGRRPMQLLHAALASCTAYDVVDILGKKRIEITGYRVEVEGERATAHPRRYTHIHVRHIVRAAGLTEKALAQAARLSQEQFCSVSASLNAEIDWDVVGEPPEAPA